jgi:hypothetical protein
VRPRIFVNSTKHKPLDGKGYSLAWAAPLGESHKHCSTTKCTEAVDIIQPDALTRTAYDFRYLGLFWEAYYPSGRALQTSTNSQIYGEGWTSAMQNLYSEDDALRLSLVALSICTIGRMENRPWMAAEGLRIYGVALKELDVSLKHPKRVQNVATLATVKALAMFEVI